MSEPLRQTPALSVGSVRRLRSPAAEGGRRLSSANGRPAPRLTVITVSYNCAGALEETIASVLGQGIAGLEYIVVDGGSTDGTPDLLRKFGDRLEYWASEPDKGITEAFNKGLSLARGELVGILNAGDAYEPGALAAVCASAAEDKSADVFYGRVRYRRPAGGDFVLEPDHALLPGGMTLSHPACFVRLQAYARYGAFDESYAIAMDYELMLRFFFGGAVFRKLDLVAARMNLEGVSNRRWVETIREGARAKLKFQGRLRSSAYFVSTVLKQGLVYALEWAGFTALLDAARSRRKTLKRTRCD